MTFEDSVENQKLDAEFDKLELADLRLEKNEKLGGESVPLDFELFYQMHRKAQGRIINHNRTQSQAVHQIVRLYNTMAMTMPEKVSQFVVASDKPAPGNIYRVIENPFRIDRKGPQSPQKTEMETKPEKSKKKSQKKSLSDKDESGPGDSDKQQQDSEPVVAGNGAQQA